MTTDQSDSGEGYLEGQLLIAMPTMSDPRFERSVIYMCAHSAAGAMGLVINKTLDSIDFAQLIEQIGLEEVEIEAEVPIYFGGPVETGRGFVLHSTDYVREATVPVGGDMALTATVDVLRAIAEGHGPEKSILALGYAGWAPGQLDGEIHANGWLNCEADISLVFDQAEDQKWPAAIAKLGIDPALLSTEAGRA